MKYELDKLALVDLFEESIGEMTFIEVSHKEAVFKALHALCGDGKKYEKALIAGELWKTLFIDSVKAFTPNQRGVLELCKYVDELIDYEDVLFAISDHYREHIIHSIWVMLIGLYLLKKNDVFKQLDYSDIVGSMQDSENVKGTCDQVIKKLSELQVPLWFLIALTHDLGYPIQKTKDANLKMAEMLKNYGFLSVQEFQYHFNIVHQPAIDILLDTLSSAVACYQNGGYGVIKAQGQRLDNAKTFENTDHGIMSAYLLLSKLDWVCDSLVLSDTSHIMIKAEKVAVSQLQFYKFLKR